MITLHLDEAEAAALEVMLSVYSQADNPAFGTLQEKLRRASEPPGLGDWLVGQELDELTRAAKDAHDRSRHYQTGAASDLPQWRIAQDEAIRAIIVALVDTRARLEASDE